MRIQLISVKRTFVLKGRFARLNGVFVLFRKTIASVRFGGGYPFCASFGSGNGDIRRTRDPVNERTFDRLVRELLERTQHCMRLMSDSLVGDIYGIVVENKRRSIREARLSVDQFAEERENLTHEFPALRDADGSLDNAFSRKREQIAAEQEALTAEEATRERDQRQVEERRRIIEDGERLLGKIDHWKREDAAMARTPKGRLDRLNHFLALLDLPPLLGDSARDRAYERGAVETQFGMITAKVGTIRDSHRHLLHDEKAEELSALIDTMETAKRMIDSYLDSVGSA